MTNCVLDQFIAKMNADSERQEVIRRRIITDARRNALNEYAVSLKAPLYDGMAGGRAMLMDLFSAKQARRLRAEYLVVAREHHIRGFDHAAKAFLAKAALVRRDEKLRARAEAPPQQLQAAE